MGDLAWKRLGGSSLEEVSGERCGVIMLFGEKCALFRGKERKERREKINQEVEATGKWNNPLKKTF